MLATVNVQEEIARIVDTEWSVSPRPSANGLPDRVTYVAYTRPGQGREFAPYWQVWIMGKAWGVRPKSEIDCAWLRIAVEYS